MAKDYTKVLLITANVGSIFEDVSSPPLSFFFLLFMCIECGRQDVSLQLYYFLNQQILMCCITCQEDEDVDVGNSVMCVKSVDPYQCRMGKTF